MLQKVIWYWVFHTSTSSVTSMASNCAIFSKHVRFSSSYLQRIICSNWNSELFQYRNIVMASHSLILVWQYHVIVDDRLDCDGRFVLTRRGTTSLGAAASQHGDLRAEVVAVAAHGRVLVFGVGTQKSFEVPSSPFPLDFSLDLRDRQDPI